ncbi:MAG: tRNA (adenosine(37)-N6)-threonylcarbamoyltransferase complex dimerization subunit type 1 TsaB [bacterium]
MVILGIETSTKTCSIALADGEKIRDEISLHLGLFHSERVIPLLDEILISNGMAIKDIDGIAVSIGPGSFTGIRIGVSTARGLAQSLNIPLVGIPSLDGLAFGMGTSGEVVCPMIDALRREIYTALYEGRKRLTPHQLIGIESWLEGLKDKGETILFLGEAVDIYEELIKDSLKKKAKIVEKEKRYASADRVAQLGLEKLVSGEGKKYDEVFPLYIRKPEAEVKWEERQRTRKI